MSITEFPKPPKQPELLCGPFQYHKVVVEGRAIPGLTGFPDGDGFTALIVDGRFSITVPDDYAHRVAWLIANAIAVAKGYPCLSATSKEMPFAPIIGQIGGDPE